MSDCSIDGYAELVECPERRCGCSPKHGCRKLHPSSCGKTEIVAESKADPVNNPAHYASGAVECIDAIQASMSVEAFRGYCKGNVQKYVWRYETKGEAESLRKAKWYLKRLLSTFDAAA